MSAPRRLSPDEDAGWVLALVQGAFAGMEGRIDPPSSMHRLTEEAIRAQARDGEVWVIDRAACVFLTPRADALYVGKLAVAPAQRREGHGRALMALAEARARALGLSALELQVRVELTENHATFAALGFSEVGRSAHPGYDRPTSITFRKVLP